jgi:hypothetical protein
MKHLDKLKESGLFVKDLRPTYDSAAEILIVKLPRAHHGVTHTRLTQIIDAYPGWACNRIFTTQFSTPTTVHGQGGV